MSWAYPPGAEHDPKAPWDQEDLEQDQCEHCDYAGKQTKTYTAGLAGQIQLCPPCAVEMELIDEW